MDPFAPGTLIAGKYQVERELGSGGVGVVALARHIELGQRVAIKYLRPETGANARSVERFKREAKLAASLRSDHVVKVYDVGALDDGTPYMVMEYLEGEDLSEVMQRGLVPIERAVQWTLEACHALEEAHGMGIVHRDLKPANFFLARRPGGSPIVKILDFGISKIAKSSSLAGLPAMTQEHEIFGTPYYMSPEQLVSSANVDARSDIWAMGVCLYELLTGRLPFEGSDLRQLVADVLSSVPAPIRDYRSDIPIELAQIVHACLQYDPEQRPRTVGQLTARLTPFASSNYVRDLSLAETSEVSGLHNLSWVSSNRSVPDVTLDLAPPPRSKLKLFAAVGGPSLLIGAVLAVALAVGRSHPAPEQSLVGAAPPRDVVVALPSASAATTQIEIIEVQREAVVVTTPKKPAAKPLVAKPRASQPVDQFGERK